MDGEDEPVDAFGLFVALRDHEGPDAFGAVVTPWLARAVAGYRDRLAKAATSLCREDFEPPAALRGEMSWELYALSRVSDVLLLSHQPPYEAGGEAPWAHRLHPLDQWPALGLGQYLHLFTALGLVPFQETESFDPFLHEIVEVEQTQDPQEPIRVTEVVWPGLWLGPLLFSRAGVRVRAGARHAERGRADRSPLYWTFLRRHRPTVDQSHGWGSHAQWRTELRLDYRTPTGRRINADGHLDIDTADGDPSPAEAPLTPAERRELLRNRCLLRTPAYTAPPSDAGWESDLYPFDWRLRFGGEPGRAGP
ncbi:hypothetical protein ACIQAC_35680 [Streptomyces sp. NPDC088387]|uniref:hypothetical protein n=1 Tax=Streptomyces sp. NPDC088387 TaxID=3365859 RepID=UPI003807C6A9